MSWISAEQALEVLGTKPQTLYANVSRGRIAARPDPADPRRSLYRAEDVERLVARRNGRRPAQAVAAETIAWGEPVMETAISTIAGGRLLIRGQDAAERAKTATLEEMAALLWSVPFPPDFAAEPSSESETGLLPAYRRIAELAATEMPAISRHRSVLVADATHVVSAFAATIAGTGPGPVHTRLAAHWQRPAATEALRCALALLSEHELNASTFAARVAASTGAPLAASVLAGLAALSGPLHGTASLSMSALVRDAEQQGAETAIANLLRQGQALPCFGHRLYVEEDVRAPALLATFDVPPLFKKLAEAGHAMSGEKPNIDFALSALVAAHDLPHDAPLQIFALARSVGWLAHALEQTETGALIRPRARYTGV
ncbi:citrate synthase [Devosia crocina]|uniref:citrate synthase (unknown stereospecificity) n=1 Tax=Devosia crocina TaxID=429728 RepID=A0A1I7NP12_9HYPH|nr:citrate synthase [Devosia crocina]SFV36391.1 citrate synthase [Devosia crocina]